MSTPSGQNGSNLPPRASLPEAIPWQVTFRALTGWEPFPWQEELYRRFLAGEIPKHCDIPTGLGKTAVVAVWLIALAEQPEKLPRRMVYVVNRRTVVDQTTREVEEFRAKLQTDELTALREKLRRLCALPLREGELPLAISTLRGQFADNHEWSADPARPAVIVGTVDMIGSRLLFNGYRIGFRSRPFHAGLLGQDVFLVHDEAHLEPAFQKLLEQIQAEIRREQEKAEGLAVRPFRLMALSATLRANRAETKVEPIFRLTDEEQNPPPELPDPPQRPVEWLWRRLRAPKKLFLRSIQDEKKDLVSTMVELALQWKDSGDAILIFVRRLKDLENGYLENIEAKLSKATKKSKNFQEQNVLVLTGTLRGYERDQLSENPVFIRFLPESSRPSGIMPAEGTVYLICTSAGEVGVNLSGDHLICDLTTFESMMQRFGRVNRFGKRSDTQVYVVHPDRFDEKTPYEQARQKTLSLLQQLQGDASPFRLVQLSSEERLAAFAPEPDILPVTDILLDAWSLTSLREKLPGRPPVEAYLHGIAAWEPAETHVAWREEVDVLHAMQQRAHESLKGDRNHWESLAEVLLEDYPLKPHELLRDRTDRVREHLSRLAQRHGEKPVWRVDAEGNVRIIPLSDLVNKENNIDYCTVVLPPSVGGLKNGFLHGDSTTANDVADEIFLDEPKPIRRRIRVWDNTPVPHGMRLIRTLDTCPDADAEEEIQGRRYWHWYELAYTGEKEGLPSALAPVRWDIHTEDVVSCARAIAEKLGLPEDLQKAIVLAAKFHDLGKRREVWQRSIGNSNPNRWLAKGGPSMRPLEITSYRHEFGSLLDMEQEPDFQALPETAKEIVLHLVAAHHGRARPAFLPEEILDHAYPPEKVRAMAENVPRRFAHLQRKFGRWGLAYLESILRAADYAASNSPSAFDESVPSPAQNTSEKPVV